MNLMNMFGANPNLLGSGLAGQDINQLTGMNQFGGMGNDATMLNPQSQQMANQGMYQMPTQQFDPQMLQGLLGAMNQKPQQEQQQMPPPAMPIQIGGGQFSGMFNPGMRNPRGLL